MIVKGSECRKRGKWFRGQRGAGTLTPPTPNPRGPDTLPWRGQTEPGSCFQSRGAKTGAT